MSPVRVTMNGVPKGDLLVARKTRTSTIIQDLFGNYDMTIFADNLMLGKVTLVTGAARASAAALPRPWPGMGQMWRSSVGSKKT